MKPTITNFETIISLIFLLNLISLLQIAKADDECKTDPIIHETRINTDFELTLNAPRCIYINEKGEAIDKESIKSSISVKNLTSESINLVYTRGSLPFRARSYTDEKQQKHVISRHFERIIFYQIKDKYTIPANQTIEISDKEFGNYMMLFLSMDLENQTLTPDTLFPYTFEFYFHADVLKMPRGLTDYRISKEEISDYDMNETFYPMIELHVVSSKIE